MDEVRPKKGFSYYVTDEQLRFYARFTPAEKLRWLAEAAEFIDKASTPRVKELHRLFREAKI